MAYLCADFADAILMPIMMISKAPPGVDASGKLRFKSDNWPMARSALDLVIQEAQELDCRGNCPRLEIHPF